MNLKKKIQNHNNFILGIDASNIKFGGGLVHLKETLKYKNKYFKKIYVWASKNTISKFKKKKYKNVKFNSPNLLNRNIFFRIFWQYFLFEKQLIKNRCNLLFAPSGYHFIKKIPSIVMIQNLIPFSEKKLNFNNIILKIKYLILKIISKKSINKSDAIIFLSNESKKRITTDKFNRSKSYVIYHGVSTRFDFNKKKIINFKNLSKKKPFRLLYLSKYEFYKNHLNLIKACRNINKKIPIKLTLIGVTKNKKNAKLLNYIEEINKYNNNFIKIKKYIENYKILKELKKYDLHIFPSLCESFGLILLETIRSSLPIVTSNLKVFKEILGKELIYFNPNEIKNIEDKVLSIIFNNNYRKKISKRLYIKSKKFSWKKTSNQMFELFFKIATKNKKILVK